MKSSGFLQRRTPLKRTAFKSKPSSVFKKITQKRTSRKCWQDGIEFDSYWERQCYRELKERLHAGEIEELDIHVDITLYVTNDNGVRKPIGQIVPDFYYFDKNLNRHVIADAKPPKNDRRSQRKLEKEGFKFRWKLLQHLNPDNQYEIWHQPPDWSYKA